MIQLAKKDNLPYQTVLWLLVYSSSETERTMRGCLAIHSHRAPCSLCHTFCQSAVPYLTATTKKSLSTNRCKKPCNKRRPKLRPNCTQKVMEILEVKCKVFAQIVRGVPTKIRTILSPPSPTCKVEKCTNFYIATQIRHNCAPFPLKQSC